MLDRNEKDSAGNLEDKIFERELAQSEIEWLRHRVEFLEHLLSVELEEKRELEQELDYTHKHLAEMNEEIHQLYRAKPLNFEKANFLAKTLVKEESVVEALTKLLSAIYSKKVLPEELSSIREINNSSNLASQSDRRHILHEKYVRLRAQYIELGARFIAFKSHFSKLNLQFTNLKNMPKRKIQLLLETRQQLQEVIQQSEQHIQQSKEYIEESKKLIEPENSLDRETNQPTGIVARQHNKVEEQFKIVNAMQKKVNEQKREERKERESTEN
jgi:hypothetical protein